VTQDQCPLSVRELVIACLVGRIKSLEVLLKGVDPVLVGVDLGDAHLTRFRRGLAAFAFAEAFLVDAARIAPATFSEKPPLAAIFCSTALKPGCALDIGITTLVREGVDGHDACGGEHNARSLGARNSTIREGCGEDPEEATESGNGLAVLTHGLLPVEGREKVQAKPSEEEKDTELHENESPHETVPDHPSQGEGAVSLLGVDSEQLIGEAGCHPAEPEHPGDKGEGGDQKMTRPYTKTAMMNAQAIPTSMRLRYFMESGEPLWANWHA